MKFEHIINTCSGKCIDVLAGQNISVIDIDGGQVVDFLQKIQKILMNFCLRELRLTVMNPVRLKKGDFIYSNLYRPMFPRFYMMKLENMIYCIHAADRKCIIFLP